MKKIIEGYSFTRIETARIAAKLSVQDICKRLHIVNSNYYSWKSGGNPLPPAQERVVALCEELEASTGLCTTEQPKTAKRTYVKRTAVGAVTGRTSGRKVGFRPAIIPANANMLSEIQVTFIELQLDGEKYMIPKTVILEAIAPFKSS